MVLYDKLKLLYLDQICQRVKVLGTLLLPYCYHVPRRSTLGISLGW